MAVCASMCQYSHARPAHHPVVRKRWDLWARLNQQCSRLCLKPALVVAPSTGIVVNLHVYDYCEHLAY